MKILHVSESLTGGPASYLQEVLPFQTREFSAEAIVLLAPAEHLDQLAGHFNGVVAPYKRSGRDLASLWRLAVALRRTLLRERPDVVHFHSSFAGAIGRLSLLTLRPRPRSLYCAHCWSFDRTRRTFAVRLWETIERWLSRFTDRIINLSPHEQDLLRAAGFPMQRVNLVVSGIADIDPAERHPLVARPKGTPLRLLFVGRFDSQKGVDLLLGEYAGIDRTRATLDLVGDRVVDGPAITIPDGVRTKGWVSRGEVADLIGRYDAVIMPSRWEAMPLLALEVLRSGRPLIGSNRGVFPYVIEDGVNGIIIDIDRPGFLDRAVTVLENSDLPAMGAAARRTYEATFRSDRMNEALVAVYRELAGDRPQAAGAASGDTNAAYPPAATQCGFEERGG